ncbi:MAG: methyltransferase domain-containing protein [Phycisphaerales bacterium]|nr:methyltransferase domain-containing protein [Phycisphaerales bacterium]
MIANVGPPRQLGRFKTIVHEVDIAVRKVLIEAPQDPDSLLDDPMVQERYKADNYLPYWPILWPSSIMMARRILGHVSADGTSPQVVQKEFGRRAIELGCGLGVAGIAALCGGWEVTFSDYDPDAVSFATHNARLNQISAEHFRGVTMDWRQPLDESFDWIIASDVLYESRLQPLLLGAIEKLLKPTGVAWISDPGRNCAEDLAVNAAAVGFRVATYSLPPDEVAGIRPNGRLYVLSWPAAAKGKAPA